MKIYKHWESGSLIRPYYLHNIILHEFGHAMSLKHEHSRPDNNDDRYCSDLENRDPISQDLLTFGAFDKNSVMNYCNQNSFSKRITLSLGDVKTIKHAYSISEPAEWTYLVRCEEKKLLNCLEKHSGESCFVNECQGGELLCFQPEKLKECAIKTLSSIV